MRRVRSLTTIGTVLSRNDFEKLIKTERTHFNKTMAPQEVVCDKNFLQKQRFRPIKKTVLLSKYSLPKEEKANKKEKVHESIEDLRLSMKRI